MRQKLKRLAKVTARSLRRTQTESEKILWDELRNRKFHGIKFLRQHPIRFEWNGQKRFFIADFYCHDKKLVIELDGKIHEKRKDYDSMRDEIMKILDLNVMRIKNPQINKDLPAVLDELTKILALTPSLFKRGGSPATGRAGVSL